MSELTVVLFKDGLEVGIVADNIEVLESEGDQVVVTATFDLAQGLPVAQEPDLPSVPNEAVKEVQGIGAAEGQVVGHSDLDLDPLANPE